MSSPADSADKGADKIADFVFHLLTLVTGKTKCINFVGHYLRFYLRFYLRNLREKKLRLIISRRVAQKIHRVSFENKSTVCFFPADPADLADKNADIVFYRLSDLPLKVIDLNFDGHYQHIYLRPYLRNPREKKLRLIISRRVAQKIRRDLCEIQY